MTTIITTSSESRFNNDDFLLRPAPKHWKKNLRYRRALIERAHGDGDFQYEAWCRANRDVVWYVDTFWWTINQKEYEGHPERAFVTYKFQEVSLQKLHDAIGKYDVLIEKSRDMGASWLCLAAITHRWHFKRHQSFLLTSRNDAYVDAPRNPKSLFFKIDFAIERFPHFLKPEMDRTKSHLMNLNTSSVIDGEATTEEIGVGDRRTCVLLDEFTKHKDSFNVLRATRDVTRCRIFNGTPSGKKNAYWNRRKKLLDRTPDRVITMHWKDHPLKGAGLYTTVDRKPGGELLKLDPKYDYDPAYPYILDGDLRSPWYDNEEERAGSKAELNQELNIQYADGAFDYFSEQVIANYIDKYCRPPAMRGDIDSLHMQMDPYFESSPNGNLRLWCRPDAWGAWIFTDCEFVIGCDIATGKGGVKSSNSVASVWDRVSRRKYAQFWSRNISPTDFAKYAVLLAKFFKGKEGRTAFLIWESNGPGGEFEKEVISEQKYFNVFYRGGETVVGRQKTSQPGWWSDRNTKRQLLSQYRKSIAEQDLTNTCEEAVKECLEYQQTPDGVIYHDGSTDKEDLDYGENHGDMVIADALANRGMKDASVRKANEQEDVPYGSAAYRRQKWESERRKSEQRRRAW